MSGLEIEYSRELAKELTKIAVVLPGQPVEVGDIIKFPFGKTGIFKTVRVPYGSFEHISNLKSLGISYTESKSPRNKSNPYFYASKNSVDPKFSAKIKSEIIKGGGTLNVDFKKTGTIYFAAIGCSKNQLVDLTAIEGAVNKKADSLVWEETYLVTSVTVAARALIMQSNDSNANLVASGEVKGLETPSLGGITASSKVVVNSYNKAAFIKDWSKNVSVFMDLVRFKQEVFRNKDLPVLPDNQNPMEVEVQILDSEEIEKLGFKIEPHKNPSSTKGLKKYKLVAVNPQDYLEEPTELKQVAEVIIVSGKGKLLEINKNKSTQSNNVE